MLYGSFFRFTLGEFLRLSIFSTLFPVLKLFLRRLKISILKYGRFFIEKLVVFHSMMKNSLSKMAEYTKSRFEKGVSFIHSHSKLAKNQKGKFQNGGKAISGEFAQEITREMSGIKLCAKIKSKLSFF